MLKSSEKYIYKISLKTFFSDETYVGERLVLTSPAAGAGTSDVVYGVFMQFLSVTLGKVLGSLQLA